MAKVGYFDRELQPLALNEWKRRQGDPAYTVLRQYDNAVVRLTLKWSGRIENPSNSYPDYWPMFVLLVQNYKADGTLANDPVDGDRSFPTEAAAIKGYEEFLLKWTQSTTDDAGAFIEQDNDLTPPAPPDPNRPVTDAPELGDAGAW